LELIENFAVTGLKSSEEPTGIFKLECIPFHISKW